MNAETVVSASEALDITQRATNAATSNGLRVVATSVLPAQTGVDIVIEVERRGQARCPYRALYDTAAAFGAGVGHVPWRGREAARTDVAGGTLWIVGDPVITERADR